MSRRHYIFDVDGTVTESRSVVSDEMKALLFKLAKKHDVVFISGASMEQMLKQLPFLPNNRFYALAQSGNDAANGLVKLWKNFLNPYEKVEIMRHISYLHTYVEGTNKEDLLDDRGGQLSFSMVGHNADKVTKLLYDPGGHKRRSILADHPFKSDAYQVRIAGTTCYDYTKKGWGKDGNLRMLLATKKWTPDACTYVGDQLAEGGNDYDVKSVISNVVPVDGPEDTLKFIQQILKGERE